MTMIITIYNLVFFAVLFTTANCACRHSYMTFCDDFDDLKTEDVELWTSLVVGDEKAEDPKLRSINHQSLALRRFERLLVFIIVKQLNDIQPWAFEISRLYTKIDYLQFYKNDLKRLRHFTFNAFVFRNLNMSHNNIEYIHKNFFYNCEITTIDLSNNQLEAVERGVFEDKYLIANKTKEIIFRNNKLSVIQTESLPSSLEILNLDNNQIDTLAPDVFSNLNNLKELTLNNNKLKSLPDLSYLKRIEKIYASFNNIVIFTASNLNNLTTLEVLDVSHNKIATPTIFQRFHFPKRGQPLQISLAYNKLTHLIIKDDSFRDQVVFLYGNPWNCKCWAKLEKFMVDNNVQRHSCDLKFFGNGETPYCINYPEHCPGCDEPFGKKCNFTEVNVGDFLQTLETAQRRVDCKLTPKVYI